MSEPQHTGVKFEFAEGIDDEQRRATWETISRIEGTAGYIQAQNYVSVLRSRGFTAQDLADQIKQLPGVISVRIVESVA